MQLIRAQGDALAQLSRTGGIVGKERLVTKAGADAQ
jgi:hypothetical protein